ncbi:MAG: isoprenylcysteine carboxylmethyltransferase family protein [Oscillospiraceae bacterium]|nr:isoprenylcysteine carboxylmethyltransferase family protein [Oscillospiraceae bacterium]
MLLLKKQGIAGDLLGKGDKPAKAARAEMILRVITYLGAAIQYVSVFFTGLSWSIATPFPLRVTGLVLAAAGVVFFLFSVTAMQNNWRAGFDEKQETTLVTTGIYKLSRNPTFLGFDLLYIGCSLAVANIFMIVFAVAAAVAFHIQVLGEEAFLAQKFGQGYARCTVPK